MIGRIEAASALVDDARLTMPRFLGEKVKRVS